MAKILDKQASIDIGIAGGMVIAGLASQQGLQSLQQVLQGAKDAPAAIGHVIFMAIHQVKQKLEEKGIPIDDKVWLANKGVVDRVLFEVVGLLYGVLGYKQAADPRFVHAVKDAIVTLMQQDDAQSGAMQDTDVETPEEEVSPNEEPEGPPQGLLAGGGMR